jgi:sulfopyruvate decarboxylase TPP-binding subunit
VDRSKTKIELFLDAFTDSGVYFASGVPDSLLAELSGALSENTSFKHFVAANEGVALSLGIGHALATGERPLIYLQNSGLGNLVNPYLSLAHSDVFQIPNIFVIGWRGEYPDLDEPQHRAQGTKTLSMLDLLDLPVLHLNKESDISGSLIFNPFSYISSIEFICPDCTFFPSSVIWTKIREDRISVDDFSLLSEDLQVEDIKLIIRIV